MKSVRNTIAAAMFAISALFFGTSCDSDGVIQQETTRTTTSSPYGYGTATQSSTRTTTVVDDIDD